VTSTAVRSDPPTARALSLATASSLVLRLVGLVVGFATSFLLARHLAPAGFGELALAITLATGAAQVADAGIAVAVAGRVARADGNAERTLGSGLALRTAFSVVAMAAVLLACAAHAFGSSGGVVAVIALAIPLSAASVLTAGSAARYRPQIGAVVALLQGVLWFGVVLAVSRSDQANLMWLAVGHVSVVVLQTTAGVLLNRRVIRVGRPARAEAGRLLAISWPLAVTAIATMAYYRLDSVVLFSTRGAAEVGLYAAAYKFLDVLQVFPAILIAPLLPLAVRYRQRDASVRHEFLGFAVRAGTAVGVVGATSLFVLAEPLMRLAYGVDFASGAGALRLLAPAYLGICLGYVGTTLGSALGAGKVIASVSIGVAVCSLTVHVWAAPRWGAEGAAAVTAVTELIIGVTMVGVAARSLGTAMPGRRLLPVLVVGPAAAAAGLLVPVHWSAGYLLTLVILVAGLVAARTVTLADLRLISARKAL
jgi:O-antigen/teichoic acid export membrane protein